MVNITDERSIKYAKFCENNFDLNSTVEYGYKSLSACVIDCIYSLRAKYFVVTVPIVERYAAKYMNGDRFSSGDSLTNLLKNIEECGGPDKFADKVLKNHQKLGQNIPKEEVCVNLAKALLSVHVDTLDDFQDVQNQEVLEMVMRSVKGMGDAGINYMFMLAGDPNRCKPDVHIHRSIVDACGESVSNDECQVILYEATEILKQKYKKLTVRSLDGIIWTKYQANK